MSGFSQCTSPTSLHIQIPSPAPCKEQLSPQRLADIQNSEEPHLIRRAQAGDVAAFNELVLRHQSRLYNIAYQMLGDAQMAADATQEAFVSAYRALGRFKGDYFRAWLTRIVKNACYDELRRRRRHPVTSLDELHHPDHLPDNPLGCNRFENPEAHVEQIELQQLLLKSLHDLPADQRLVIILSDIEGYNYSEIAQIVNAPLGTVKSRLSRGRLKMRASLQTAIGWLYPAEPR